MMINRADYATLRMSYIAGLHHPSHAVHPKPLSQR